MTDKQEGSRINLELMISLVIVMVTVLGSTIPLHLHTSSQIEAIHQEMKDFHGRLEKIDTEFKAKCVLQDQEFKHHVMMHHKEK